MCKYCNFYLTRNNQLSSFLFFFRFKMKFLLFVLLLTAVSCFARNDEFPKNDYKTFFKDLNEALGLEQLLDSIGFYFRTYVRIGQAYTWKKFERDWKDLKTNFSISKAFHFVHKIFWVCISQVGVRIINTAYNAQIFLWQFLENKCDKYLGRDGKLYIINLY